MSNKRYQLTPPTNSNSQNFSETFDEKSRHAIVRGMDQLHVIIKLPFKRPENLTPINKDSWTEEKEARLFRYLEDTPKDAVNWDEASEMLDVPKDNLIKRFEGLDKKPSLVIGEKDEHPFLKDEDQDEGRVSIFKEEAYPEEIQGEPYQKNQELESVSRRLESLELNQAKENFKQPTSSNEPMGNFPPENKPASEDDAPLSGMSSPFSNISEECVEQKTSDDYLTQLKHSAFSLFK